MSKVLLQRKRRYYRMEFYSLIYRNMYLVSEVKKKTKTGGKGICQVYHMSNTLSIPDNVTQQVADRFGFDYVK